LTALLLCLPYASGCHRVFTCDADGQCAGLGVDGVCEAEGFCSFPDGGCPSGRRFGEHAAADLIGACVDEPAASTSGTTSSSTTSTSSETTTAVDSGGSTTTGSAAEDSGSSGFGPCDPLREADPLVVEEDGATIEHLRIVSDGEPAIRIQGATGVTIRDVEILHRDAPGLVFAGADDIHIVNVLVTHDGAPEAGPHDVGGQANIEGRDAAGVVIENVRVTRGSSGIELDNTPGAVLSFIEGHDVRGPGVAAFVRLHESDQAILEDFSIVNPLDTGRPQTLVQISSSSDVIVRRGLLDGHNAQYGYGVGFTLIAGQHSGGLVEDVDAVRMTNGGFTCFPWGMDITFRRTRARDNICEIVSIPIEDCDQPGPNGGCVPGSGSVSWTASFNSDNIVIEDSTYYNLCATTHWPAEVITIAPDGLVEEEFEPHPPIAVAPSWSE
jgi:hypothetical protein